MRDKILKLIASATVGAAILACASASGAAPLVGAETIEITSAYTGSDSYIQVAELEAFNQSGVDVALASNGATASAPDTWQEFNQGVSTAASNAIDGVVNGNYSDGTIFHSGTAGSYEYLDVTLAAPSNLSGLEIFGRTDCCTARDIYNVQVLNAAGSTIYSGVLNATGSSNSAAVSFTSAAPEPATWAMMLLGTGLIGGMLRLRARTDREYSRLQRSAA